VPSGIRQAVHQLEEKNEPLRRLRAGGSSLRGFRDRAWPGEREEGRSMPEVREE